SYPDGIYNVPSATPHRPSPGGAHMKIEMNVRTSTLRLIAYTVLVLCAGAAISFGITEWRSGESAADRLLENSRDSGLTPVFAHATTRPCNESDTSRGCVDLPIYDPSQATEEAKKAARWATVFTVCFRVQPKLDRRSLKHPRQFRP